MSTIDPTRVDPNLPTTGDASTALERAQRQVLQEELTNAKTDIESLESSVADALVKGDFSAKGDLLAGTGAGTFQAQAAGPDGHLLGYDDAAATGLKPIDPSTVGTTDHAVLSNRDAADQHPIGAVTGLQAALDAKMATADYDTTGDGVVDAAESLAFVGTNGIGSPLAAGELVQFDSGGNITQRADAATGLWAYAITGEAIGTGATGRLVTLGLAFDVNTTGFAVGDMVYCGASGGISATPIGDPYQAVGVVLAVGASGAIWFDPAEPQALEADGALGLLTLTDVAGSFIHGSSGTWSEVVPGAGETALKGAANTAIGANPGRLALDFSGAAVPPAAGAVNGEVSIHLSAAITSSSSTLDVSFGLNGALIDADVRGTIGGGGNQVSGTIIPLTLSIPMLGLSDGDELSIFTRGTVDTWVIEAFSVQFVAQATGTTGGGGGTSDHQQLTNRAAPGAHPAAAVSNTPAGGIVATDVQGAVDELDGDKADKAVPGAAGNVATLAANGNLQDGSIPGAQVARRDTDNTFAGDHYHGGGKIIALRDSSETERMRLTTLVAGRGAIAYPGQNGLVLYSTGGGGYGFLADTPATGEFRVQNKLASELGVYEKVGGTDRQVLNPFRGATIGEVGYAGTPTTVPSGGTFTPGTDANGNQMVIFTNTIATTIAPMTVDSTVEHVVPDGLALVLTGYEVIGAQEAGRVNRLITTRVGGTLLQAVWL